MNRNNFNKKGIYILYNKCIKMNKKVFIMASIFIFLFHGWMLNITFSVILKKKLKILKFFDLLHFINNVYIINNYNFIRTT